MSPYPIAMPFLGDEEAEEACRAVHSGWVAQGPRVAQFEERFCQVTGAAHACAVSNGTSAIHLALQAVGVQPGDVVLTVSHSFIATANAVRHCQAEPVFVDIDSVTYNMDVTALDRVVSDSCEWREGSLWYREADRLATGESPLRYIRPPLGRVSAILAVHQIGIPCRIGDIVERARVWGLPVVEDAACAIGSQASDGRLIGQPHGDAACFSFHPRKVVTTGEGGVVTTSHSRIDAQLRLWRSHGMTVSAADRHRSSSVQLEGCETTGYNCRMSDIQAAVGVRQLERLPVHLEQRRRLAGWYARRLQEIEWVEVRTPPESEEWNWQSYPIALRPDAPMGQIAVMQHLLDGGISTRRGVMNAHQEPPYLARDRTILLPLYHQLEERDIDVIVDRLRSL